MYHHLRNIVYYPYHDTVRMTHFCSNLAVLLSLFRKSINYFFLVSHSDKHISNCAHVCSQTSLYFPISQSSRSHARSHTRACARARTHTHTHTEARAHIHRHTHTHTQRVSWQGSYNTFGIVTRCRDKADTLWLNIGTRVIHSVYRKGWYTRHRDSVSWQGWYTLLNIGTRVIHSVSWQG